MIVVIAQYIAKPLTAPTVRQALERMATRVRELEPGCLIYHVSRSLDAPDEWALYEVYRDRLALEEHRGSDHFRNIIVNEVIPLLISRESRVYELVIR